MFFFTANEHTFTNSKKIETIVYCITIDIVEYGNCSKIGEHELTDNAPLTLPPKKVRFLVVYLLVRRGIP